MFGRDQVKAVWPCILCVIYMKTYKVSSRALGEKCYARFLGQQGSVLNGTIECDSRQVTTQNGLSRKYVQPDFLKIIQGMCILYSACLLGFCLTPCSIVRVEVQKSISTRVQIKAGFEGHLSSQCSRKPETGLSRNLAPIRC